jgi:dTDP-4-dehydrorhamnose reductase
MRIALLGKDGQIARELRRSLAPLGELVMLGRSDVDLRIQGEIGRKLIALKPDVIVNTAAYTKVDMAESNVDEAFAVNSLAVKEIAEAGALLGCWLVHFSTDYIFDGMKATPYLETDSPAPLNVYGHSKLAGERHILASTAKHLIFRTSWVYSLGGKNFLNVVLENALNSREMNIVREVVGVPTDAALLADVTALVLYRFLRVGAAAPDVGGIYNLTPGGSTNWFDYAGTILRYGVEGGLLPPNSSSLLNVRSLDAGAGALRPKNSGLDNTKIQQTFNLKLPDWDERLKDFMGLLCKIMV